MADESRPAVVSTTLDAGVALLVEHLAPVLPAEPPRPAKLRAGAFVLVCIVFIRRAGTPTMRPPRPTPHVARR